MTRLADRKTRLSVELPIDERGVSRSKKKGVRSVRRPIIATLQPYGLELRLKGTRVKYEITYGQIYNRAVMLSVEKQKAERKAAQKAKKAGH